MCFSVTGAILYVKIQSGEILSGSYSQSLVAVFICKSLMGNKFAFSAAALHMSDFNWVSYCSAIDYECVSRSSPKVE